jgi:hypothetical protein
VWLESGTVTVAVRILGVTLHGGIDARARTIGFDGDRERGVRRGGGEEEPESRD